MRPTGLGLVALTLGTFGCGLLQGPGPESVDPGAAGSGPCDVEVRNEVEVALTVSARAGLIQLGTLQPGARLRFSAPCGGRVTVVGRTEATSNAGGATCTVSDTVTPREGEVALARLQMRAPRPGNRGLTGCRRV